MKIILLATLLSILLCLVLGKITIPFLRKFNFSQTILSYVSEHKHKNGTPTMGGIFLILSATLITFIFCGLSSRLTLMATAITLAFACVGFIDDFIKIKCKQNLGLTAVQKSLFQLVISVIASFFIYQSGLDFCYIPFTFKRLHLGIFSIVLNVLVFVATVNSVNLLDGLDGLCSGVSGAFLFFISMVIICQLETNKDYYIVKTEYYSLVIFSMSAFGAILAYLVFNTFKASVFMGDTGSLGLGGIVSTVSIFTGNSLYICVIGIMYLITTLSVIVQVISFKKRKKRVFLMAPLHHHFIRKGYSEAKIFYSYTFITIFMGILVLISVL